MRRLGSALVCGVSLLTPLIVLPASVLAQQADRDVARRAAIHPVSTAADMRLWLSRVPVTRDFPPDFEIMLRDQASLYVIEISTAPGCLPCGDLWTKLLAFRGRYGWQIRTLGVEEAALRSGRLGLPWVGNPVAWVRPMADPGRMVPIAIGTDHCANIARNAWLAARMLAGARAAVGVRAMSKFTGIVGVRAPVSSNRKGR
ncbi:hypothetical protein D0Z70_17920 [Sphingobium terrigena]|uniref:Uncharacterized protein n=1 Tax=Sphingobium terrigena TaxID=2304063 RepID=A0A418YNT9_9SPHN|nr:hypothetical protein [Sphingobium terrigena]RJG52918.1 hypothetical protein D0Z70_17920 [Sphingobium terrigena]